MKLENFVQQISDEELVLCFKEIKEYRQSGILKNGIVRKWNKKYEEHIGFEYPATRMEDFILFEIGKRWCNI